MPTGHKANCKCAVCKAKRGGGKKSAKTTKKSTKKTAVTKGGGVQHKAYTYTNKKGNKVTVAAHVEYPRGK